MGRDGAERSMQESGGRSSFSDRVAPRLRTAPPAEADGSFPREGPVPSVDNRSEGHERRGSLLVGEKEGGMTTLLILAVVVGTLSGLAQQQRSRKAVVVRRSSGLSGLRVR